MSKTLVLAEKPSVGRELARVLGCKHQGEGCLEGDRYVVTWALGHLVELSPPEEYDKAWAKWDMLTLPMLPEKMKTQVIPQTSRQFRAVQALMRRGDISDLVIATDSGREGELVARWIMEKAGWKKPAKRLWISSQTDKAIKEGFAHLRPASEYDNLFRSARARSEADWLVGLNVTRALTCKFNAQLSAGRVQTPTLALIVDREQEIRRFVPKDFFTLVAKTPGFTATWRDKKGQARIFDRAQAEALAKKLEGKTGVLTQVKKTWKQTPPPPAYDLTELQRDANRKYAYSAKETLSIMQNLYEIHKVLTYPRTDSRYISDDVVPTLPECLRSVMVDEYKPLAQQIMRNRPLQTRYLVNNAKVTDHHAIIPTEEQPDLWRLTGPERNIYDLVVRRFLAVLLPPFTYEEIRLTMTVDGETFTARGKIVKDQGWKAAYSRFTLEEDEGAAEDEDAEQNLPPLSQGDKIKLTGLQINAGKTAPPKRYTEATLLTAMEHPQAQVKDAEQSRILEETGGLGTPGHPGGHHREAVLRLLHRAAGQGALSHLQGYPGGGAGPFRPAQRPAHRQMGEAAGGYRPGQGEGERLCGEMRSYASRLVSEVKASDASYHHDNQTRTPCPDCGKYLLKVKTKRGEMLVCPDRECGYRRSVQADHQRPLPQLP